MYMTGVLRTVCSAQVYLLLSTWFVNLTFERVCCKLKCVPSHFYGANRTH